MSELATVARPYAKAVFDLAKQSNALEEWSNMLSLAASVANDAGVQGLLQHPKVEGNAIVKLFNDVSGNGFSAPFQNFLKLLGENRRIAALGDIAEQFETERRSLESRIKVTVHSATEIESSQVERLKASLKTRYQQDIDLDVKIDASLIGGAIIHAGDEVIDGTVKGRLEKMTISLLN